MTSPSSLSVVYGLGKFADLVEAVPVCSDLRQGARVLMDRLASCDPPLGSLPAALSEIRELLFSICYRTNVGDGPYPVAARRIRLLIPLALPQVVADVAPESAVLTADEAAAYLGLDRAGVSRPGDRVRYLVKRKKLRATRLLGRNVFQRSDLDEFLIRCRQAGVRT